MRDEKLWNRARKLANADGLSGVIHDLLTDWVRRKEAEMDTQRMAEVELSVGGKAHDAEHDDIAERIAFTGRLIADSANLSVAQLPRIRVYQTRPGKFVVYRSWEGTPSTSLGATYRTYADYESLAADRFALDTMWIEGSPERDRDADHSAEFQQQVLKALGKPIVVRLD